MDKPLPNPQQNPYNPNTDNDFRQPENNSDNDGSRDDKIRDEYADSQNDQLAENNGEVPLPQDDSNFAEKAWDTGKYLTPIYGDYLSFQEAETGWDYVLATAGIIPTPWTKGAKLVKTADKVGDAVNAGRKAEKAGDVAGSGSKSNWGSYRPNIELPKDKYGNKISDSEYPHTQLGTKNGRNGSYTQGREWSYDNNGNLFPKRDVDFTNHGRADHPNPHQHTYTPNATGGTYQRGGTEPLE